MSFENDKYWFWLSCLPKMWHGKAKKAMSIFKNPEEIYKADEKYLKKAGIFSDEDIYNIVASKGQFNIEDRWEGMKKKGINFTCIDNNTYPELLRIYDDKPVWLFYKGELPGKERLVGRVGARNCSQYGRIMAEEISYKLGVHAVGVVSGMARGIDAAAHIGSIRAGGKTYAILGCGVDECYPRENIGLYMQIIDNGGIISEYPPGTKPLAWQFPERNRIISMMSESIMIMEAKKQSGSLITAEYALQYGKDVFALPGRVGDKLSEGCNELIKSGAMALTEVEDILCNLGVFSQSDKNKKHNKINIVLEKENEVVYSVLDLLPQGIEEIIRKTGMNSAEVLEVLMQLILEGLVVEPVKNHYARKK